LYYWTSKIQNLEGVLLFCWDDKVSLLLLAVAFLRTPSGDSSLLGLVPFPMTDGLTDRLMSGPEWQWLATDDMIDPALSAFCEPAVSLYERKPRSSLFVRDERLAESLDGVRNGM
jgi:hypothetical protein